MEFCFGSTFITDSAQTAQALTFDPELRAKCVTLEGDSYDPSGTLRGGSRKKEGMMLAVLKQV